MYKMPVETGLVIFCMACALAGLQGSALASEGCRAITLQDYPAKYVRIATHTDFTRSHYPQRIAEFSQEPLGCGDIVMLGDSLTERQNWSESLVATRMVRNRGISGDTSDGVLARLDEIIAARPRAVFLLIGTNDLWSNNSAKKTAKNIDAIILALRSGNPQLPIFLQTIFPLRSDPARNQKVRSINAHLSGLASKQGVILIDTYSALVDEAGLLGASYTDDGVHLTPAGYKVWITLLNDKIGEIGLSGTSRR